MPLQYELPKSYRRIFIDPIVPSVTVGAVTGTMPANKGCFMPDVDFVRDSASAQKDGTAVLKSKLIAP